MRAISTPTLARRRRAPALVAGLAAVVFAGCFDVRSVDPGPVVLDDFDDGDLQPADPTFTLWSCRRFNPDTSEGVACDRDSPGFQGNYSLRLTARVEDVPNSRMDHAGAALVTRVVGPVVDMTRFQTITFSAKVESGQPPLPATPQLLVELGCKNVQRDDMTWSDASRVTQAASFSANWQTVPLRMQNFISPSYDSVHFPGGPAECLVQVDSVRFALNAELDDGGSAQFTLWIDSISFQ